MVGLGLTACLNSSFARNSNSLSPLPPPFLFLARVTLEAIIWRSLFFFFFFSNSKSLHFVVRAKEKYEKGVGEGWLWNLLPWPDLYKSGAWNAHTHARKTTDRLCLLLKSKPSSSYRRGFIFLLKYLYSISLFSFEATTLRLVFLPPNISFFRIEYLWNHPLFMHYEFGKLFFPLFIWRPQCPVPVFAIPSYAVKPERATSLVDCPQSSSLRGWWHTPTLTHVPCVLFTVYIYMSGLPSTVEDIDPRSSL